MTVELVKLHESPLADLQRQAQELGIPGVERLRRTDLVFAIARRLGDTDGMAYGRGVLEVHGEGFGFLRSPAANFLPGPDDIYVSQSQIRRFDLQTGDTVIGIVRPPKEGERYTALLRVESINGDPPGTKAPSFDALTAIYPDERIPLFKDPFLRAIDRVAPLGLGQRGLLVAPPRTGRVDVLHRLADHLTRDEDLEVTVLLLAAAPEEIQEWRATSQAEVIATPFDEPQARHLQVADIVFERARRMVEHGDDVVLLVDSLTRLIRACLAELPPSGRDLGGADAAALHRLRRYVGSARALEEGGSLTVIGVVSGDPESKLDRALVDDLRDVVNWELALSRDLADRGIRPPIDVHRSGTRRAERLLDPAEAELRAQWRLTLTGDPLEDAAALVAALQASGDPDTALPTLDSATRTGH
jgi:transcription termination factor Rho